MLNSQSSHLSKKDSSPQGSTIQKASKKSSRKRSKRVKKAISGLLTRFACFVAPLLYILWMKFVWFSSKVISCNQAAMRDFDSKRQGFVFAMWHQETFISPFRFRGLKLHALASTSTMGRIVTAILESNNFQVFRGGRNRRLIIRDMIRHINQNPHAAYGLTVDGSRGPARVMKRGACTLARACGKPLYLVSTQAKRTWHLKTWDRFAMPLPFGAVKTVSWRPYWIDPRSSNQDFAAFCQHIEEELLHLTTHVNQSLNGGLLTNEIHQDYPSDWKSEEWQCNRSGRLFGEWDLQLDSSPPWAA